MSADNRAFYGDRDVVTCLVGEQIEQGGLNGKIVGVLTRVITHDGSWGCITAEVEPKIKVEGFVSPLQVPVLAESQGYGRLEGLCPGTELYILAQVSLHPSNNGFPGKVGYEPVAVFVVYGDDQLERVWGNLDPDTEYVKLVIDRRGVVADTIGA